MNAGPLQQRRKRALGRPRPERRVIAVTGSDTFLGRNILGLLEEDPSVSKIIALDIVQPTTAKQKTRFYKLDLTQPSVDARLSEILHAEEVDTFVHLAFLAAPTPATTWAHELESVGTMHVLNACREQRVGKFILWSQTALYGPHASNPNFLTEEHPLRGLKGSVYLRDKIEAETETRRFAEALPNTIVTVLRLGPMIGPTVRNYVTAWLSRRFVPTMMGFDPLVQVVHEMDAVGAFKLAIDGEARGAFNIVADGVLPISTVIKLAGRTAVPVPHFLAQRATSFLWSANLSDAPPAFFNFLKFLCVCDGTKAKNELGFRPTYTTREAVLDFEGALRLREAHLLQEGA